MRENEIQLKITNQALETYAFMPPVLLDILYILVFFSCKTEIGRLRDAIPQDSDFKNLDLSQVQDYSSELTATLQVVCFGNTFQHVESVCSFKWVDVVKGEKVKLDTLRHDITELEMQFNDLSARKEQMEHKVSHCSARHSFF